MRFFLVGLCCGLAVVVGACAESADLSESGGSGGSGANGAMGGSGAVGATGGSAATDAGTGATGGTGAAGGTGATGGTGAVGGTGATGGTGAVGGTGATGGASGGGNGGVGGVSAGGASGSAGSGGVSAGGASGSAGAGGVGGINAGGAAGSATGGAAGSAGAGGVAGSGGVNTGGAAGSATGGAAGSAGAGGTGGILNDACPGETLALSGTGTSPRTASVSATTAGLSDDATGSCSIGYAPDAIYAVTPDVSGIANITLSPAYDGAVYVRTNCNSQSSQVACRDQSGSGGSESVTFWATANQTYYVFADGYGTRSGSFTLDISIAPETADEKCPGEAVAFTGSGTDNRTAQVSGDTRQRWPDSTATCSGGNARDAVYAFTPDVDGRLTLTLQPSGWDTAMYVRTTCTDSGSVLACVDTSGTEQTTFWATAGTTYYVFVDGYGTQSGAYTLDALLRPALASENCPGEAVVWSGTDPKTFSTTGDTSLMWNDSRGSTCAVGSAEEAVYAVTPDSDGILRLRYTPSGYDAALYLRTTCDVQSSELACFDSAGSSGAEGMELWATSGTTYYAFLDGYGSSSGSYTFDAQLFPAKAREKCDGETLTLSGTPLSVTVSDGDLSQRWPDYTGTCASNTNARDAVFHVVAPQQGTMHITVVPSGFDAALYVRRSCATASSQVACRDMYTTGGAETLDITVGAADVGTDYFIFVDSYNTGSGTYTLTVSY